MKVVNAMSSLRGEAIASLAGVENAGESIGRSEMSVGGGLASHSTLPSVLASVAAGAEIDDVDAGAEIDYVN